MEPPPSVGTFHGSVAVSQLKKWGDVATLGSRPDRQPLVEGEDGGPSHGARGPWCAAVPSLHRVCSCVHSQMPASLVWVPRSARSQREGTGTRKGTGCRAGDSAVVVGRTSRPPCSHRRVDRRARAGLLPAGLREKHTAPVFLNVTGSSWPLRDRWDPSQGGKDLLQREASWSQMTVTQAACILDKLCRPRQQPPATCGT